MTSRNRWLLALFLFGGIALTPRFLPAQTALEPSFNETVKPFFNQNCVKCHNSDLSTAGIRVDQLDATLEDRQIPVWEAIRRRVHDGSMPPKGLPEPTVADRQKMETWIGNA
jgi:mono/diheme cytochrome c family protein